MEFPKNKKQKYQIKKITEREIFFAVLVKCAKINIVMIRCLAREMSFTYSIFTNFYDIIFILGTSTRKPRLNSALVSAQQAATQIQFPGSSNPHSSKSSNKISRNKNKRSKYVRLKNIDRSTGQTREVTVNSVTVFITEYKPKIVSTSRESRHGDSSDFSESNDSRS